MLATYRSLPLEVWFNVFNHIESSRNILECRLVCRSWGVLAEQAFFATNLSVNTNTKMQQLYDYLTRKPALGKCIRSIDFSMSREKHALSTEILDSHLLEQLLPLLLNPNIQHIHGGLFFSPEMMSVLQTGILNSAAVFKNLKTIPRPRSDRERYSKTIYALRNTLESIVLNYYEYDAQIVSSPLDYVIEHLGEFRKLTQIKYGSNSLVDFVDLNTVLQSIQSVPEICFDFEFQGDDWVEKDEMEMINWLTHNVQPTENVKKLEMMYVGELSGNLVEYVAFKFPKLHSLRIGYSIKIDTDNFYRTFAQIQHIPTLHLATILCDEPTIVAKIVDSMKSTQNFFKICYAKEMDPTIDVNRSSSKGTTHFTIETRVENGGHKEILAGIGTACLLDLTVDLITDDYLSIGQNSAYLISFEDIITTLPQMHTLHFYGTNVLNMASDDLKLENLTSLKMEGAYIEPGVISTLDKIAPKLNHLELLSCVVLGQAYKTTAIKMPNSTFSSISISDTEAFDFFDPAESNTLYRHYLEISKRTRIKNIAFVRLNSPSSEVPEQFFMLIFRDPPMQISKEEFLAYSQHRYILHIECKSLSLLTVKNNSFDFELNFQDGKPQNLAKSSLLTVQENMARLKDLAHHRIYTNTECSADELNVILSEIQNSNCEFLQEFVMLKAKILEQKYRVDYATLEHEEKQQEDEPVSDLASLLGGLDLMNSCESNESSENEA